MRCKLALRFITLAHLHWKIFGNITKNVPGTKITKNPNNIEKYLSGKHSVTVHQSQLSSDQQQGDLIHSSDKLGFTSRLFRQLPSVDSLKSKLLVHLERINDQGAIGLLYYILGFSLYELAGLSTVPVETISGMVFGFQKGSLSSAAGKILGALLAFTLGRTLLLPAIKSRLNNDTFLSIAHSVSRHQLKNALFLKFSIFPEIIKNFSMAAMDVSPAVFLLVTIVHGVPYTILWNWLGHDTSKRMKSTEPIPPNYILNSVLFGVTVFGFVGSPSIFAFWLRSLQKDVSKGD